MPWALLASCMLHPSLRNGNKIRHAERYPAPNPGLSGSYPAQCLCKRVWVNYAWHWKNDHPNPMSLNGPWLKGFWLGFSVVFKLKMVTPPFLGACLLAQLLLQQLQLGPLPPPCKLGQFILYRIYLHKLSTATTSLVLVGVHIMNCSRWIMDSQSLQTSSIFICLSEGMRNSQVATGCFVLPVSVRWSLTAFKEVHSVVSGLLLRSKATGLVMSP